MVAQTTLTATGLDTQPGHGVPDTSGRARANQRWIAIWLLCCCALVFAMVVLGGTTRLTGSGLSMVTWKPVSGVVPPLSDAGWLAEFERYRRTPEFQHVNSWMTVADFKRIYWLEFYHRLLGRLIGVVFFVPLLYFALTRRVPRTMIPRLITIFVLGGLQGLLGWFMVKSGLVEDPHVSQYRLTAHLGAAVIIYSYMLWVALGLLRPVEGSRGGCRLSLFAGGLALAVFLTMLSGGFVAGLHAGLAYNTFPLMAGQWVPDGMYTLTPAYLNWFENAIAAQFNHRVLAISVLIAVFLLWLVATRGQPGKAAMLWVHAATAMALAQVILGISTLLLHVPVPLAVVHQGGAVVLITLLLGACHFLRRKSGS